MCYSMIAFLLVGLCYSFSETFRDFYESNIKTSIFFWNDKLAEQQGLSGSNKEMRLHQVVYVNNLIENHFFIVTHFRKQGSYCTAIRFCRAEAFRVRTGNRNTVLIGIHQMITTSVIREESVSFINHFLPIGTFGSFVRFVREQFCSVRISQV